MSEDEESIKLVLLSENGTPLNPNQDLMDMYDVWKVAIERYLERDKVYKGLWKEGGWPDSANHVRHKGARVGLAVTSRESQEELGSAIDDALDGIIYNSFFVLNAISGRNGKPTG